MKAKRFGGDHDGPPAVFTTSLVEVSSIYIRVWWQPATFKIHYVIR